ncbi:uncharacterized protein LOC129746188 [Uranotaenia lowii]|uniref:uncharacterized protein LOC129746188 n=1 Tax=Uranotaenia lowii TaxID=190385 RepID=UPI00247AC92A|nr:uncharacterized protein LOC129746188 [Uranotaenia lowii]
MAKLAVVVAFLLIGINGFLSIEKSSFVAASGFGHEIVAAVLDSLNLNLHKANQLLEKQHNAIKAIHSQLANIRTEIQTIKRIEAGMKKDIDSLRAEISNNENKQQERLEMQNLETKTTNEALRAELADMREMIRNIQQSQLRNDPPAIKRTSSTTHGPYKSINGFQPIKTATPIKTSRSCNQLI